MVSYTLNQLECFVAAADAQNTMEAAVALHVSQSALSMSVANLEQGLGVQLFIRQHGRRMTLTAAGIEMLPEARRLLSAAADFERAARELGTGMSGRLSVATTLTLAQVILPRVVEDFARLYPEVRIEHHDNDFDTVHQALVDGTCELALAVDHWKTKEITRVPMAELRPHAVLPPAHPLAKRESIALAELAAEPIVLLDMNHAREYYTSLFESHGLEPVIKSGATTVPLMYEFVARGVGLSLVNLPSPTVARATGDPLVFVPIEGDLPPLQLVIGFKAGAVLTRRAQAFVERCQATIDDEPMLFPISDRRPIAPPRPPRARRH